MFSWYKYLIVSLVFYHLGFWSGNLFLIAPFPDLCLLVPSYVFMFYLIFRLLYVVLFGMFFYFMMVELLLFCRTLRFCWLCFVMPCIILFVPLGVFWLGW